jgi:hypothetical protein
MAGATNGCRVDGCQRIRIAKGLCSMHYIRMKKYGSADAPVRAYVRNPSGICVIPGCGRKTHLKSMCTTHSSRKNKHGDALWQPTIAPRGTGSLTRNGYVMMARGDKAKSRVLAHRLVVEKYIGRRLLRLEVVHHRNGNRTENTVGPCLLMSQCECSRRHNLELWSKSQPPGQRVCDKLAWAREIIALYG